MAAGIAMLVTGAVITASHIIQAAFTRLPIMAQA